MFLQINAQNYITGYATVGGIDGGVEVPDTYLSYIDPEKVGYLTYSGATTAPTYDTAKHNADKDTALVTEIRARRIDECFIYTDRGKLWYDKLTTPQFNELKTWYEAWLNAPATKVIPTKPAFLNNSIY
jgi:hypothetical protein